MSFVCKFIAIISVVVLNPLQAESIDSGIKLKPFSAKQTTHKKSLSDVVNIAIQQKGGTDWFLNSIQEEQGLRINTNGQLEIDPKDFFVSEKEGLSILTATKSNMSPIAIVRMHENGTPKMIARVPDMGTQAVFAANFDKEGKSDWSISCDKDDIADKIYTCYQFTPQLCENLRKQLKVNTNEQIVSKLTAMGKCSEGITNLLREIESGGGNKNFVSFETDVFKALQSQPNSSDKGKLFDPMGWSASATNLDRAIRSLRSAERYCGGLVKGESKPEGKKEKPKDVRKKNSQSKMVPEDTNH